MDAQRLRDALCKRLNDARGVEDYGDRDGKHNELHEAELGYVVVKLGYMKPRSRDRLTVPFVRFDCDSLSS